MADKRQKKIYVLGTEDTPLELLSVYQGSSPIYLGAGFQLMLEVDYTMGSGESGNSIQLKLEFNNDDTSESPTVWRREITESASSGTVTMTQAERTFSATQSPGTYDRFEIPLPIGSRWLKVSAKETGVATNEGFIVVSVTVTYSK